LKQRSQRPPLKYFSENRGYVLIVLGVEAVYYEEGFCSESHDVCSRGKSGRW